jgi:hypothetical protein
MICETQTISINQRFFAWAGAWYGQGGHWINHGLTKYAAIDQKPERIAACQNEWSNAQT